MKLIPSEIIECMYKDGNELRVDDFRLIKTERGRVEFEKFLSNQMQSQYKIISHTTK